MKANTSCSIFHALTMTLFLILVLWNGKAVHSLPVTGFTNPTWVEWLREQKLSPSAEGPLPTPFQHSTEPQYGLGQQYRDLPDNSAVFAVSSKEWESGDVSAAAAYPSPSQAVKKRRVNENILYDNRPAAITDGRQLAESADELPRSSGGSGAGLNRFVFFPGTAATSDNNDHHQPDFVTVPLAPTVPATLPEFSASFLPSQPAASDDLFAAALQQPSPQTAEASIGYSAFGELDGLTAVPASAVLGLEQPAAGGSPSRRATSATPAPLRDVTFADLLKRAKQRNDNDPTTTMTTTTTVSTTAATATITSRRRQTTQRAAGQRAKGPKGRIRTRSRAKVKAKQRLRVYQRRRQNVTPTTFRPTGQINAALRTSTEATALNLPATSESPPPRPKPAAPTPKRDVTFRDQPVAEPLIQTTASSTTTRTTTTTSTTTIRPVPTTTSSAEALVYTNLHTASALLITRNVTSTRVVTAPLRDFEAETTTTMPEPTTQPTTTTSTTQTTTTTQSTTTTTQTTTTKTTTTTTKTSTTTTRKPTTTRKTTTTTTTKTTTTARRRSPTTTAAKPSNSNQIDRNNKRRQEQQQSKTRGTTTTTTTAGPPPVLEEEQHASPSTLHEFRSPRVVAESDNWNKKGNQVGEGESGQKEVVTAPPPTEVAKGAYHELHPGQYHEVNPGQYDEVNPGQYHEVNPGQYHEVNPGQYHEVNPGQPLPEEQDEHGHQSELGKVQVAVVGQTDDAKVYNVQRKVDKFIIGEYGTYTDGQTQHGVRYTADSDSGVDPDRIYEILHEYFPMSVKGVEPPSSSQSTQPS